MLGWDVNDDGAADYFSQLSYLTAFAVDGSGFGTTLRQLLDLD